MTDWENRPRSKPALRDRLSTSNHYGGNLVKIKHLLLAIGLALALCQSAHARGFVLFNSGNELFEVADFPSPIASEFPVLHDLRAGYKCDRFGIFLADVWTWNCKLVAVTSEPSYAELPEKVVSQLSSDSDYSFRRAKRCCWNHYGVLTLLAALGGLSFLRRFF